MWNRTKRLINSYLDELIDRTSEPDKDVRRVTHAELARLNELEVQTLASVKMFEKELAEIELKMIGLSERERIARERGDLAAAENAGRELVNIAAHRDLLRQQISEGRASAARSRALRDERQRLGEDLATETHLTAMREDISGLNTPFSKNDPASTIDEMRARLNRPAVSENAARLAEAELQFEEEQKRARADEMLARYKSSLASSESNLSQEVHPPPAQASNQVETTSDPARPEGEQQPEQPKTLGRNSGPVRPID